MNRYQLDLLETVASLQKLLKITINATPAKPFARPQSLLQTTEHFAFPLKYTKTTADIGLPAETKLPEFPAHWLK